MVFIGVLKDVAWTIRVNLLCSSHGYHRDVPVMISEARRWPTAEANCGQRCCGAPKAAQGMAGR